METKNLKRTCSVRRNRDILAASELGLEYKKAAAVKKVLREALEEGLTGKEIKKRTMEEFTGIDFPTKETGNILAVDMARCINRYVKNEQRIPRFASTMDLNVFRNRLTVKPDLIFMDDNGIEVVKVRVSKNYMTKAEMVEDLELYALCCYAKALVPAGCVLPVKASYYFLRKKTDDEKLGVFEEDFFDSKGKNIVSMQDLADKTIHPEGQRTELDEKFDALFNAFYAGTPKEYVSEDECKTCDFYHICNFKQAPQYVVKEHKVCPVTELTLTENQKKAISFQKGVARINAGAGAGKTLVVALRVVTLMLSGVKPEEICLLTFTNSGAEEMKERVQLYNLDFGTGADTSRLLSSTFNSFANNIVTREWERLGYTEQPMLIDDVERMSIIAQILEDNYVPGLDYRNFLMNETRMYGALAIAAKAFHIIKTYGLQAGDEEILQEKLGYIVKFVTDPKAYTNLLKLYLTYDNILQSNNLIEYADQELLMFKMLETDPDYFENMHIRHIIVDEFQDSNEQQIRLMKELKNCSSFESLMVVGDDSQAIFSFRDTTPEYIVNFFDIIGEKGEDFFLLENHRSTPEIIELANKLNALNKEKVEKDLIATRAHGTRPVVRGFFNKSDEGEYIVGEMIKKIEAGRKPEEMAFIASNKYELLEMGVVLTEAGIPWVMLNPEPVLENSKVVASIALAEAIQNPDNTKGMLTYLDAMLENKILSKSDEEIDTLLLGLKEQIKEFVKMSDRDKQINYHEMIEALDDDDELFQNFIERLKSKHSFEKELKYLCDFKKYGEGVTYKRCKDYPGVVLTTAHSSKGLEWDVVFASITKFHTNTIKSEKLIEEKRRLLFVTLTRARDELYITGKYVAYGPKDNRTYNMFLKEVYECLEKDYDPDNAMMYIGIKKEEAEEKILSELL